MVSPILALLSLLFGFLAYAGIPVIVARYYGDDTMLSIGEFYFWLSMHSFRRLAIVRRRLSGYILKPFSLDDEKQAAQLSLSDDAHVQDPANTVARLENKPLLVFPEQTPTAVNATVSELGEWWGKHVQHDNHIQDPALADGGNESHAPERVNPYFRVPSGLRLVDPSQALHLIPSDTDPSDPKTAEDITEKSQEKFRDRIGAMETVATISGFLASAGLIVGVDQYVLDDGGGGGSGVPAPPIPMGQLHVDPTLLTSAVEVLPL